jgi:N-alpha-acetyltransferase 35, NatC auxiliary subunit
LLPRFDSDEIKLLLDEGLSWIERADIDHTLKIALECRLIFRQELLNSFQADQDHPQLPPPSHLSCVPLLAEINRTAVLGKKVEDAFSLKVQRTLASSVPPRPMVTIQFPEAVLHLERLCYDATDVYQLCEIEGSENLLSAFWTFMSHKPLPSVYVRTLAQSLLFHDDKIFSKQPLRDFLISDLDSLVLPNDRKLGPDNGKQETSADQSQRLHKLVEEFISRCSQPYLNYFRTSCLNRCRIRRTLCHACVEWDNLQAEAEDLDGDLRVFTNEEGVEYVPSMPLTYSYPLSSWAYHYKLLQLERTIQMGFELSIYAPDELCGMYWYLSHVCATHLSQLDRMSFFAEKHGGSTSTPSRVSALDPHAPVDKTLQRLFRIFTHVKATEALARALHRLYAVLVRNDLLAKPVRPYSSNRLRHELRMKPFLPLSVPEPVDFDEFERAASMSNATDVEALDDASGAVAEARKSWEAVLKAKWVTEAFGDKVKHLETPGQQPRITSSVRTTLEGEWISDVKNVLRACIAASIAIGTLGKTLRKAPQSMGDLKDLKIRIPEPGGKDCYHDWWLAPTITEKR